ncbi:MAG TPA: TRAP transporter small permease [Sphaerochaetaceae bacterium]|nr:TRAP transporter small permease [Sphaerochaetaceae bacterium]
MLRKIYKLFHAIRVTGIIAVLTVIITLGTVQIVLRYFSPAQLRPFPWGDEIMRLLNIWMVFLAASLGAKENTHLSMDFLIKKLFKPERVELVKRGATVIVIVALGLIIYHGTLRTIANTRAMLQNISISISWFYAAIPVGCAYLLFDYLLILIYGEHPFSRKKEIGEEITDEDIPEFLKENTPEGVK